MILQRSAVLLAMTLSCGSIVFDVGQNVVLLMWITLCVVSIVWRERVFR